MDSCDGRSAYNDGYRLGLCFRCLQVRPILNIL